MSIIQKYGSILINNYDEQLAQSLQRIKKGHLHDVLNNNNWSGYYFSQKG